jgi:hypothetical protein
MKLREEGLLMDDGSYYVGRFLAYEPVLQGALLAPNAATESPPPGFYSWKKHFLFVQDQMKQLRAAFALAKALDRVLVLPRVAFICESFFYPGGTDCVIEGHRVRIPYVAPTDHWLRPGRLTLPHREPGFVDNPRFPQEARAAAVTLAPCDDSAPCGPHETGARVPSRSSDGFIRTQLERFKDRALVRVTKPLEVWGGFERAEDTQALDAALSGVLGAWCCLKNTDQTRWSGVETLQAAYKWEGPPELTDNAAPGAAKTGA